MKSMLVPISTLLRYTAFHNALLLQVKGMPILIVWYQYRTSWGNRSIVIVALFMIK